MQIIESTEEFQIDGRNAIAIGKFDGIHKGHTELLKHILKQKENGMKAVVFTFNPPASVYFGKSGEKELTPLLEKRRYFQNLGIDVLVEFPLNRHTAATPAKEFIERILAGQMNAAYIVAGTDLSFGDRGMGNKDLLQEFAAKFNYQVQIIDKITCDGREISSSYVREEVEKGNMEKAAKLLGRNYTVTGVVETGKKLGRRLGMPTLNLYPPEDKLLPPNGVYYSYVSCKGKRYNSITNIGQKPTVNDMPVVSVESYLYGYAGDMYGEEIVTELIHFRRPEMKFRNMEELKCQMEADVEAGRKYHENEI
ncbi:MAG: bifunctional riboflavin kinase/FAD synthetase [Lachnospiraceae bacterium]|nr:bifunctional riboflavin kinase/FAD synthetase [Lachnospiraceae bacterium]